MENQKYKISIKKIKEVGLWTLGSATVFFLATSAWVMSGIYPALVSLFGSIASSLGTSASTATLSLAAEPWLIAAKPMAFIGGMLGFATGLYKNKEKNNEGNKTLTQSQVIPEGGANT